MKRRLAVLGATGAIVAIGIALVSLFRKPTIHGEQSTLENSESFILFSLDPNSTFRNVEEPGTLVGYKVLGQTKITDAKLKAMLIAALYRGMKENSADGDSRMAASCFNPGHAIQAVRNGRTVNLLISFQCYQISMIMGGRRVEHTLISRSPRTLFDQVLKKAKVPLYIRPNRQSLGK